MGIEQELTNRLKDAMKAKETNIVSVIRMVKSDAGKQKVEAGFDGNTDDTFWTAVIAKYVKQQSKAIIEFKKATGADEQIAQIQFEIDYLSEFLPSKLSTEETEKLVDEAIAATGADSLKLMGKIMGFIMKNYKDSVDGALVKQLIQKKFS